MKKQSDQSLPDIAPIAAPAPIADEGVYGKYELARIRKSPDNRKRFDEQALQELAASIKQLGVVQAILIRPVTPTPEAPEEYEIVAGERRYRASIIAGVLDIPAMCRNLSDLDAAKIRILENLQREDPHPMEEADGYQQLMLTHGFTAEQLAAEIHKSKAYIYARLKLCALTNDAREQFLDNKIPASTALLIARIPLPKLQCQALREVLEGQGWPKGEPMSVRVAATHIQSRYMLDLGQAVFPINDARLHPAAGACSSCPKRTGNQPEVFADLNSADVCTDPDCHSTKRLAHYDRIVTQAEKKGIPVLEGEEARQLFSNAWLRENKFVRADLHLHYFERNAPATKNHGSPESLLGDDLPPPAAYTKASDGVVIPWYNRVEVQAALEKAGACETVEQHTKRMAAPKEPGSASAEDSRQQAREAERKDRDDRAAKESVYRVELYRRLRKRGAQGFSLASLREFAKMMVRDGENGYSIPDDLIGDVYPFDRATDDAVCTYIDQASLPEVQLILVDLALGECLQVDGSDIDDLEQAWRAESFRTLEAMAIQEGIDPTMVRIDVEMEIVDLKDLLDSQIGAFVRVNPHRINELKEFILQERPHLLTTLEAAAGIHGFKYGPGGFSRTQAVQAPETASAEAAPAAPQNGDMVACEGEDLTAAIAETARPKKAPRPKAPANTIRLSPAAAWPFPKSSTGARETPAAPLSTAASTPTQEAK